MIDLDELDRQLEPVKFPLEMHLHQFTASATIYDADGLVVFFGAVGNAQQFITLHNAYPGLAAELRAARKLIDFLFVHNPVFPPLDPVAGMLEEYKKARSEG